MREEQWVDELTVREVEWDAAGEPVVRVKQARLDLVVRNGAQLWWVDFSFFRPFIGSRRRLGERAKVWSLR